MTSRQNLNVLLYKKLYLIRRAEQAIIENYQFDEMKTPMHMSMGEEAIVAGICQALSRKDQVFGTYRSHALYLAKTGETDKFFAEMYGKKTGAIKGKAGSMHLLAPELGLLATSAVVASTIPVAAGSAFANKFKKNKRLVAVFFGDGAIDEGAFWESLNIACLMKLPILLICEDNGFAVHSPARLRHGYESIVEIVAKFNCRVFEDKTTDAERIYHLTLSAIDSIKRLKLPSFMYLRYYRYLEHVGVNEDFNAGYRQRMEFLKWLRKDPIKLQREKLFKLGINQDLIEKIEIGINEQVTKSLENAKTARFPDQSELLKDVFYGKSKKN